MGLAFHLKSPHCHITYALLTRPKHPNSGATRVSYSLLVRALRAQKRKLLPAPVVATLESGRILGWQRLYHARTAGQMTEREVAAAMADPRAAPDSDDEDDVAGWKAHTLHIYSELQCSRPTHASSHRCQRLIATQIGMRLLKSGH